MGLVPYSWDAFISHASEDKEAFVLPLASLLRGAGFRLWLDVWCLEIGASLSMSIQQGLVESRFGIVILSHAFFAKQWPRTELGAMLAAQNTQARVILPVWYGVNEKDVRRDAALMADRVAAKSDEGITGVAEKLIRALKVGLQTDTSSSSSAPITLDAITQLTNRLYPGRGVDQFWQARMFADLDSLMFRSIGDLERAVMRAKPAVEAYAAEHPNLFTTGTDFLTKSLGFVDLCFRQRHNWGLRTREAFEKYGSIVDWSHD